jgi:hypothetical protein
MLLNSFEFVNERKERSFLKFQFFTFKIINVLTSKIKVWVSFEIDQLIFFLN